MTLDDYCGLAYNTWVSNRIVDFAISSYMAFVDISDERRESIFIASTEMYLQHKYFIQQKKKGLKLSECLLRNLESHTKGVNIFEKKFILIPVLHGGHWRLICAIPSSKST